MAVSVVATSQVTNSCKFVPASDWASPGSIVSGDVIVAFVTGSENSAPPATVTPPTGFTLRASSTGTQNLWAYIYTKVLTGSEPTEYVFQLTQTAGPGANAITARVFMAVYHNVDTTTPVEATGSFLADPTSSASSVAPAVTTVNANAMVVSMFRIDGQLAITSNVSGATERLDDVYDSVQNDFSMALADQVQAGAGSSGTHTATHTATTNRCAVMIALKASGGTPSYVTSGKGAGNDGSAAATSHQVHFLPPAGAQAGDYILVEICSTNGMTVTAVPTGFTLAVQDNNPGTLSRAVYYKLLGASEPLYYSFTLTKVVTTFMGVAVLVRGAGSDALIIGAYGAAVSGSSSTSTTAPSITVLTNGTMVIGFFFAASTVRTFTPAASWTEVSDVNGIEVAWLAFNAGATGTVTAVANSATNVTGRGSVLIGIPVTSPAATGVPKTTKQMLLGVG